MALRLDRYLSNTGYGSRSEVKKWIKNGLIALNGKICLNPSTMVDFVTNISLKGQPIKIKPISTIMMNKPKGFVSSNDSESGYPSVIELIKKPHPTYAIAGRLDVDTTGLLILSTQGELVHSIISPSKKVQKLYKAVVTHFDPDNTHFFYEGIQITKGFQTKPVTFFKICDVKAEQYTICLGITEGRFHQVKKMFQMVHSEVIELERIAIGSLRLDPSLKHGEYKELTETDILNLFSQPEGNESDDMLK